MGSRERERLESDYDVYRAESVVRRRLPTRAGNRLIAAERDAWWQERLHRWTRDRARPLRILDVGCGPGGRLTWADAVLGPGTLLCGVDLLMDQLRRGAGGVGLRVNADATKLPFRDDTFDLVVLSTVLSSVPHRTTRGRISAEARRVVRARGPLCVDPGLILWYDMRLPNPWNRRVRPVSRREVRELFPGDRMELATITLLPPVARLVCDVSPRMARWLARVPLLRSHSVGIIEVLRP